MNAWVVIVGCMKRSVVVLGMLAGLAVSVFLFSSGPVVAQGGGTIIGEVRLTGEAPALKVLKVNKDSEVCGPEKTSEDLVVGPNKGLKWAVASLVDGKFPAPDAMKKATLDQSGCAFKPHVVLVPAGGSVDILNNDGILHNVHTYSTVNPSINKAQPKFKKVLTEKLGQPEAIQIRCDAHHWMSGWVVVADSPYYAVTDDTGSFKLDNVPAGKHKLQVWHETLGKQIKEVEVKTGETLKVAFDLKKD